MNINTEVTVDTTIWKSIKNQMMEMKQLQGESGFYSEPHPNGRGATLAQVAVFNEYGTEQGIPARPFFKPAAKQSRQVIGKMFADKFKEILLQKTTVFKALEKISEKEAQWIRERILFNSYARTIPNAPFTQEKKGFNRPLYETGYLADNVEHKVVRSPDA